MADNKKSVNLLPEYLKTDKNSKFLSSTVDPLIQSPQLERIDGYVGSVITPNYNPTTDFYLKEELALRKNYSLEPALVFKDLSSNITDVVAYDDIINDINIQGGKTDNLDKVFRSKFYSYDPCIDWDKLVNYTQYYWLPNGPDAILIDASLNVDTAIVGQPVYTMPNGLALSNGMKIVFSIDVSPAAYQETEYYVEGVGSSIKLIAVKLLEINESLVDSSGNFINEVYDETFDSDAFDSYPFDGDKRLPLTPEYITINRASIDLNPWSRYNRWFHSSIIETVAAVNKQVAVFPQDVRAKRPIVEFKANIQLYNFGSVGIENVDVIDTDTVDAFRSVDGTIGYYVDGMLLEYGNRVIFNADANDDVRGKIYRVNYDVSTTPPTLRLVEDSHLVAELDSVSINSGNSNAGTSWYYDATNIIWVRAQQHTTLNQAPLFDLFDDRISYTKVLYTNDFAGSKLFGYDVGTGSNDAVLGFPLKYQNSIGVGSYLFKNYFMTDTISVTIDNVSSYRPTGITRFKVGIEFLNVWKSTAEYQIPVVETRTVSASTSSLTITSLDKPVDAGASVIAYVNDVKVASTLTVTDDLIVNFSTPLVANDSVALKITTSSIPNASGYYEAPLGLTNNPLNGPISDMTLSELSDHVASMVNRTEAFVGVFPGTGNLRDLSDYTKYGTRLIINSNPIAFAQAFLGKKEHNVVDAIRLAANQYNQFKMNLLRTIVNSDSQLTPADALDVALKEVNNTRDSRSPHYRSDMLGYGSDKTVQLYTVSTTTVNYATGATMRYDTTALSFTSLLVYVNGTQQIEGKDYTFYTTDEGWIKFPDPLASTDSLAVHYYKDTRGAFVPATPSKLGLYPKFEPLMYDDDSYTGAPISVIRGHDGSITKAYGDYRDDMLLEFEKRIYNNIKVAYNPAIFDVDATIPGAFREDKFPLAVATGILTKDFIKWTGSYGVDAATNTTFDEGDPFTWNYKGGVDTLFGRTLSGSWRSLYNYFYDTDRPHTHPWEMLGFSSMPSWWISEYGAAPYLSTNPMWADLEIGFVRDTATTSTNYVRPGLSTILPVDITGALRSPDQFLVSPIAYADKQAAWAVGDFGPAETAWRKSSYWPFVANATAALLDPCTYTSTMYDVSRTALDQLLGQVTYLEDDLYLNPNKLVIEGYEDAQTAGYGVFVVEKGTQKDLNYVASLKQDLTYINFNLFHKVGGFVSKDKLQIIIDSIDPVSVAQGALLPPEDYTLLLNVSNPVKSASISGVVIQKSNGKFVVRGYDKTNPYFEILKPIKTNVSGAITVGGVSAPFTEWTSIVNNGNRGLSAIDITSASSNTTRYYKQGQIVRYNSKFYRVKIGHNAQATFDTALFQVLPSLPMTGGATAALPARYEATVTIVSYGTEFSSIQEVYDLLVGYGAFLESQGFLFDEYNADLSEIVDWKFTGKEFLYWTTQNWADNNLITLSPFADYLKYTFIDSVVDDVSPGKYEYSLLKADGKSFPVDKFSLSREDGICKITTVDTQEGIFFATLNSVQKEHAMVFNNTTMFNDTMYDIETGYKQRRIKLSGFRTSNWNGDFFSPGFVYDDAKISEWKPFTNYKVGDVVRVLGEYHSANANIVASATFNINEWSHAHPTMPTAGLLPNFDYKINQFEDFYSLDIDNFDAVQQQLAQHLVGYSPRAYFNNIFTNPVTQYKFYQGYIKEKGTKNAIDKLSKVGKFTRQGSVSFNEDWAFRVGHYGSFETYNEIEFSLEEGTSLENPYVVKFVDSDVTNPAALLNYVTSTNLLITPTDYVASSTFKTYPGTFADTNIELTTAGYVRTDDVTATAYNKNSLLDIANNSLIQEGDTIWLGFLENGGWTVYRYARQSAKVAGVFVSAPGSDITFVTDLHHGLSVGDIVSVDRFNDQVNGIHIVTALPTLNQFTVASTLTTIVDAELLAYGALFKFEEARHSTLEDLAKVKDLLKLKEGDKIWVDEGTDSRWQVYEKIKNYNTGTTYDAPAFPTGQQLGQCIYTTEDTAILLVSAPGWKVPSIDSYGIVSVYEKVANTLEKQYDYVLNSNNVRYCTTDETTEFGYSLAYDDNKKLYFVGAPGASKVIMPNTPGVAILSTGTGTITTFTAAGIVKISSRDTQLNVEQPEAALVNPYASTGDTASYARFGHSVYTNQVPATTSTLLLVGAPGTTPDTSNLTVIPIITLTSATYTATSDYTSGPVWLGTTSPATINGVAIDNVYQTKSYTDPALYNFTIWLHDSTLPQNFFDSIKGVSGMVLNTAAATSYLQMTNTTWWTWQNVYQMLPNGSSIPSTVSSTLTFYSLPTYTVVSNYTTASGHAEWIAAGTGAITSSTVNGVHIGGIEQTWTPSAGIGFQIWLDNNSLPQNFFDSIEGVGGTILYTTDATYSHLTNTTWWVWNNISAHMIQNGSAPSSITTSTMRFLNPVPAQEYIGAGNVYAYLVNTSTAHPAVSVTVHPAGLKVFSTSSISLNDFSHWGHKVAGDTVGSVIAISAPYYEAPNNTATGIVELFDGNLNWLQNLYSPFDAETAFGDDVAISPNGTYMFVSSVNVKLAGEPYGKVAAYSFNGTTATLIQVLDNPLHSNDLKFGHAISISEDDNTLLISALGTNRSDVLRFDIGTNVGETTFDAGTTQFIAPILDAGTVYVYSNIGGLFVQADELDYLPILEGSKYGTSVVATNNNIFVGAPSHTSTGTLYQFNKADTSVNSWKVLRQQPDLVDITTVSRVALIDSFTEELSDYLDVVDPLKGKIAGIAEQELKYKAAFDPATYSIGIAGTINDTNSSWIDEHIGELWWDLSTAKYVWYEQGDDLFRKNNWNKLFPGASIDIYEWIKSDLMPSEWAAQADTNEGLTKGISGQPKYPDNSVISVKQLFNNVTGAFENVYYYWVKNKVTVPDVKNRRISSYQVASIIADPVANGLKFVEFISPDSVAFANVQPMLVGDRISANIATDNTNSEIPRHTEWLLLAEGATNATPPALLEKKLFDSLLGHDADGNAVPDPTLSYRNRYGIGIRPQQTLFKDRIAALQNLVEFTNSVLIKSRITGNYNFDNLNTSEQIPDTFSREYDCRVESLADLNDTILNKVNTSTAIQAELECFVVDGRIRNVSIVNPGYGYILPPSVEVVSSTTSSAEILTEIDSEGKVIGATVVNSGNGYITAPQLVVRPHTVIVIANEDHNGLWTKHVYNYTSPTWIEIKNQTYNTSLFWEYVDWVDTTYSAFKDYKYVISDTSELSKLYDVAPGDYVKINNIVGPSVATRYAILEKVNSTETGNFSTSYNIVYSEHGTIQILDSIWNFAASNYAYDIATLDGTLYDQLPDLELYYILTALKEDIFIGDLKANWNLFFFTAVKYALSEQKLLDWAFKTSFINVVNTIGTLDQRPVYKLDNEQYFEDYIAEVKPYHTQIRNYISQYDYIEGLVTGVGTTDFDLPSYYNTVTQQFEVVTFANTATMNQQPWKSWADNYTYEVGSVLVADGGTRYTTRPVVTISGGGPLVTSTATAEAYLRNGSVYQILVTNPGAGYTVNPVITITGGGPYVTSTATASVTMSNSTVRKNLIGIKFDRVSADNEIGITSVTDTFVCSGEQDKFVLTWLAEPNKLTIIPLLDGKLVLSTDYTIEYYTEEYNGYSKKYSKFVFLNLVPLIDQVFKITYNKNVALYTAVDRIDNYYTVTNVLPTLMSGVEYPLPIVRGLPFDYSAPWDTVQGRGRYDTTSSAWSDLVDYYTTAKLVNTATIDSSVLVLNTTTGIVPGQVINILNSSTIRVRADTVVVSVNTGAHSITISRPTYTIHKAGASALSIGSTITVVTSVPFNGAIGVGDIVTIGGITEGGFNGLYTVDSVISDTRFNVAAVNILSTTTAIPTTASSATISTILTTIDPAVTLLDHSRSFHESTGSFVVTLATLSVNVSNISVSYDHLVGAEYYVKSTDSNGRVVLSFINMVDPIYELTIDVYGYPTIEFWKPDFNAGSLDVAIDGATWNGFGVVGALGIAPLDKILDGDAFLNISSGYAPEECVAGHTIDSLGVNVYTKADNSYAIAFTGAIPVVAGTTTTFTVGIPSGDATGIMLHFGGKIFNRVSSTAFTSSTQYYVAGNRVIMPPQVASGRAGYTLVSIGGNYSVLDSNVGFVENQTFAMVEGLASINDVRQAYVLVDGLEVTEVFTTTNYGYMLTTVGPNNKRACVKVYNMPMGNHTVEAWFFESKYTKFNRIHEELFIVGSSPQTTFVLSSLPGTIEPVTAQTIVEVGTVANPTARKRLTPPWVSYYELRAGIRTFAIDNKHTHPINTFSLDNVLVYANGVTLRPGFDYSINRINSEVTITLGLLIDGDVVAIMGLTDQEYVIMGTILELTTPINDTTMKVISFTDHDNMLMRTDRFDGTLARRFVLSRPALGDDYVWVYVNGIPLTARYDYEILEDSKTIQISDWVAMEDGDDVLITTINPLTYGSQILGFRVFKDMFDRLQYRRLAEFYSTTLAQPLRCNDTEVYVVDADRLIPPNPATNRPGVILVDSERIEFFKKDGNVLRQLRRSTLGTGPAAVSEMGTTVIDQSQQQSIPFAENEYRQYHISTTSTIYAISTVTTTATSDGIVLTPDVDAVDQVMVYYGGRQLRKSSLVVHDKAKAYDTTSTSITVMPPEFTITTATNELVLNIAEVISTGIQIAIIQRKGHVWTGTESLLTSTAVQAKFLRAKEAKLPDIYYYGG